MRTKKSKLFPVFWLVALMTMVGCNTKETKFETPEVSTDPDIVTIAKAGGEQTFVVKSNRPWTIEVQKDDSQNWINVEPMSGNGGERVTVSAFANTGEERSANLKVKTSSVVTYIKVSQDGIKINELLYESMGSGDASSNPFVDKYSGWLKQGLGASTVAITGSGASVRQTQPSSGYPNFSGGNNIWLAAADGNFFAFDGIKVGGTRTATLTFGRRLNTDVPNSWLNSMLKIEMNIAGIASNVEYTTTNSSDWASVTATLTIPAGTTEIGLKFIGTGTAMRLDDFRVTTTDIVNIVPVPAVTSNDAVDADIAETTAKLTGSYTYSGTSIISAVGIAWKKHDATQGFAMKDAVGVNPTFNIQLDNLEKYTKYDYYAYAKIGTEVYAGETKEFTTKGAPEATLKAIKDIRALKSNLPTDFITPTANIYQINENWKTKGVVVSNYNKTTGGSFDEKNIAIQDLNIANSGITIRLAAAHTFAMGDEIEVVLTGAKLSMYNGLLQIAVAKDADVTRTATPNYGTPSSARISIDQLKSGDYESMYVSISSVQVKAPFLGETMYDAITGASKGNIEVETTTGDFVMYTSSNAAFKATAVPQGNGILRGIGGIFRDANRTTYRIQPQIVNDFEGLTGSRFGGMSVGVPDFTGTMTQGAALSGAKITIPYYIAAGTETYNYTVAVSGAGSAGITASAVSGTFAKGNGDIVINVTGTPTASGAVTFTISGTPALTTNTCTATVGAAGESVIYETGFESSEGFVAGTSYNKPEAMFGPSGKEWAIYFGTASATAGDRITGDQYVQMRWYASTPDNIGYAKTTFNLQNVTKVVFTAKNTSENKVSVAYSEDNGLTWKNSQVFDLTTTATEYTYNLRDTGVPNAMIKFMFKGAATIVDKSKVTIDDVKVYGKK